MGLADESAARWLDATLTPQPRRTLTHAIALAHPAADALPRTYIHCPAGPLAASVAPSPNAPAPRPAGNCIPSPSATTPC
jgi:hypothetical protein